MIVVVIGAVGGVLVSFLGGIHLPKIGKFPGLNTRPLITSIVIPPLIGMIALGFVARNFVPLAAEAFPSRWAYFIRMICLCLLLLRGGLNITFRGQGITVVLIAFVPQACEALVIALIGQKLFSMPFYVAYTLGYSLACISPSVLVPCLMNLMNGKYGIKKNIPS
jgi:hypothetical protein